MVFALTTQCKLYLLTPPHLHDPEDFKDCFETVLSLASDLIACVQIRLKPEISGMQGPRHEGQFEENIRSAYHALAPLARSYGVPVLLNDRVDLAVSLGADGIHLGQGDMPYDEARARLGEDKTIGITCHNDQDLAFNAAKAGADYVAFGSFYTTTTKQVHTFANPQLLTLWSKHGGVPSVAIGGITPDNARPLCQAGADFLAVCSGLWSHREGPLKAISYFRSVLESS